MYRFCQAPAAPSSSATMDREIDCGYWVGVGRGKVTSGVAKGGARAKKGNGIFLVFTDIDPQHEGELNAWYTPSTWEMC
jgi:hypothetical protein